MRHRTIGATAVVSLAIVASCGSDDEDADGAQDGDVEQTTTDDGSSPGGGTAADTAGAQEQDETQDEIQDDDPLGDVDGPPWGPDDPIVPGRYGALHPVFTDTLDCSTAADEGEGEFWQFVGAACAAALGAGEWPGGAIPAPPPTDNPYTSCLDEDVVAWLQRLEAHFAVSGTPPQLVVPTERPADSCRTRIYLFDVRSQGDGVEVDLAMELPNGFDPVLPDVVVSGVAAEATDPVGGDFGVPQLWGSTYVIAGPFGDGSIEIEATNLLGTSTIEVPVSAASALDDDAGADESDEPSDGEDPPDQETGGDDQEGGDGENGGDGQEGGEGENESESSDVEEGDGG